MELQLQLELDMFIEIPCEDEWNLYLETGKNVGENLWWIIENWNHEKYGSDILYEVCKIACSQNGCALSFVPRDLKTPELCEIACKQDGTALCYAPVELITPELCEIACSQDGWALDYVPVELRTSDLCEIAGR